MKFSDFLFFSFFRLFVCFFVCSFVLLLLLLLLLLFFVGGGGGGRLGVFEKEKKRGVLRNKYIFFKY